ncbi:hypothetical protein HDU76_010240 [Blyttiomyces sp. JEL0837]|nr:hypothetical protein HDU76_010240 [Blyttiomyces sp. JEL0837]
MSVKNLSIVIGPNLFRPPAHLDSIQRVMADMPYQCGIAEILIEYADWVFGPVEFEEPAEVADAGLSIDVGAERLETDDMDDLIGVSEDGESLSGSLVTQKSDAIVGGESVSASVGAYLLDSYLSASEQRDSSTGGVIPSTGLPEKQLRSAKSNTSLTSVEKRKVKNDRRRGHIIPTSMLLSVLPSSSLLPSVSTGEIELLAPPFDNYNEGVSSNERERGPNTASSYDLDTKSKSKRDTTEVQVPDFASLGRQPVRRATTSQKNRLSGQELGGDIERNQKTSSMTAFIGGPANSSLPTVHSSSLSATTSSSSPSPVSQPSPRPSSRSRRSLSPDEELGEIVSRAIARLSVSGSMLVNNSTGAGSKVSSGNGKTSSANAKSTSLGNVDAISGPAVTGGAAQMLAKSTSADAPRLSLHLDLSLGSMSFLDV